MNAISLFSGIGGLDIGFAAAGFNIIAQVEIDEYCQRVLRRHAPEWWPHAAIFADVRKFGRASVTGNIDVIFGGFPCQPHSVAGKRLGAEDDRDMWPETRRIIGELRPRAILLENVPGILAGYAVNVIADLAALGYDCKWGTIRASDTGAPHKRERWFCLAYNNHQRQLQPKGNVRELRRRIKYCNKTIPDSDSQGCRRRNIRQRKRAKHTSFISGSDIVAYTKHDERQNTNIKSSVDKQQYNKASIRRWSSGDRKYRSGGKVLGNSQRTRFQKRQSVRRNGNSPRSRQRRLTQSRMGRANDGIPAWLDKPRWPAGQGSYQHEWEAPRTIGKGIDTNRTARVKALGNAVVPQVAYPLACEIIKLLLPDKRHYHG